MTLFGPIAHGLTTPDPVIWWFLAPIIAYFVAVATAYIIAKKVEA